MSLIALFLAAATVPKALLDAFDQANLADTECVYGTMRTANAAHLSVQAFEEKLRSGCSSETQRLHDLGVRIFTLRGDPDPEGEADRLDEESYRSLIEEYRRLPEIERRMRDYEPVPAHCMKDPASCD